MTHGVCEGLWLRSLLSDLGLSEDEPIRLYCDNKAAINIAHNPVQHDRTKHIEVDRHFVKENIEKGLEEETSQNTKARIITFLLRTSAMRILHWINHRDHATYEKLYGEEEMTPIVHSRQGLGGDADASRSMMRSYQHCAADPISTAPLRHGFMVGPRTNRIGPRPAHPQTLSSGHRAAPPWIHGRPHMAGC
ncbi:hypothetical protein KSP39_PZI020300 [Platanthera zijinensis]|uniref:Copia protein n=1 Tax=Platanthera zijinensis TaxID=2320716 RepID=A0AAP0B114_9ASPA